MKFTLFTLCYIVHSIYGHNDEFFKVFGGQDVDIGIAPYMCALKIYTPHPSHAGIISLGLCGCSILSNKWVLTAAHCIEGKLAKNAKVLVGTNHLDDSNNTNHENTRKYYEVERWIGHQHWVADKPLNDVAVVKIKEEIKFSEQVKPIRFSSTPVPGGVNVRLTGWGKTHSYGESTNRLQIINMTAVPVEECAKRFKHIDDQHLCTFTKYGQGGCQGDSGCPIVFNSEVVGVVSYVANGCTEGFSDVFARISHYYEWIENQIKS